MKKLIFLGVFAFLLATPLAFCLSSDICQNVSNSYRSDCKEIIKLDLSDDDKLYMIEHIKDSYSVFDSQQYSGLFSEDAETVEYEEFEYNPKENINRKFWLIFNLLLLFFLNYFLYGVMKKYSKEGRWIAE